MKPSFSLFSERAGGKAKGGDYMVMRLNKLKLAEHDMLLKKFRHKEALVSALGIKNPKNVVVVLEELVVRRKLFKCVVNLDNEELGLLSMFLHKHTTVPRYSALLMGLTKVLEMHIENIRGSEALKLKDQIRNLKRSVEKEIQIQHSLQGIISPLLRIVGGDEIMTLMSHFPVL